MNAASLGIRKVARRIAVHTTSSSGHGEDYGFPTISLPHVTLIDGPRGAETAATVPAPEPADDGRGAGK